jgi:hypothetical protein
MTMASPTPSSTFGNAIAVSVIRVTIASTQPPR